MSTTTDHLSRHCARWTQDERDYAARWAGEKTYSQIGADLGRTELAVRNFIENHTDIVINKAWGKEDLDYLRGQAGKRSAAEIAAAMGRTRGSVVKMAVRIGFSVAFRPDSWSDEELDTLRNLYPTTDVDDLARIMGRSAASIKRVAGRHGIRKLSPMGAKGFREFDRLCGEGLTNHEIAARLGISVETVFQHRKARGLPRNKRGPRKKVAS